MSSNCFITCYYLWYLLTEVVYVFALITQVQIYAAAHLKVKDANQGFVLKGCGDDILTTLLPTTQTDNAQRMNILSKVTICIYVAGNFIITFGGLLVIWELLHKYRDILTRTNQRPSFDNYSWFWGCVALSVVVNVLLTTHTLYIVTVYVRAEQNLRWMGVVVALQSMILVTASLFAACRFSCNLSLNIPSIYVKLLVCCICEKAKMKIVVCLALWSFIQCALHIFCYVPFLVLAMLASLPTFIFTLLVYIIIAFCAMQFLASIFMCCNGKREQDGCCYCAFGKSVTGVQDGCGKCAFCKSVTGVQDGCGYCASRNGRKIVRCFTGLVPVVGYLFLCVAFLAFIILISAAGVANYGNTDWSRPFSFFSTVFPSAVLAAFTWGFHKIATLWFQHHMDPSPEIEDAQEPDNATGPEMYVCIEANECTSLVANTQT